MGTRFKISKEVNVTNRKLGLTLKASESVVTPRSGTSEVIKAGRTLQNRTGICPGKWIRMREATHGPYAVLLKTFSPPKSV